MAIFAFGGLAGTGGAILVTQAKAAGEPAKAQRLFSATLALLLAMSVLFTAVVLTAIPSIVRFLGATTEMMPLSVPCCLRSSTRSEM